MSQPCPFTTLPDFLLNAPLYKPFKLDDELVALSQFSGRLVKGGGVLSNFDGHCPFCGRNTTLSFARHFSIPSGKPWEGVKTRTSFDEISVVCARDDTHVLRFWLRLENMIIMKAGQWPSIADLAIDEIRIRYRSVLNGENWSELYKAAELAAHGEGIGAFVYLRRIIERLMQSRFEEFKAQEAWVADEFDRRQMVEKIEYIGRHLPPYLVVNRQIYAILSSSIQELDSKKCLDFYEVGFRTIMVILQDDLARREELEHERELRQAIAKFDPEVASLATPQ
jgi:hypothetical protein